MEKLFVYGTLRDKLVRKKITGRNIPSGKTASLQGYTLSHIIIDGIEYPIVIENPNAKIPVFGEVLKLTPSELRLMDEYEGPEYRRELCILEDGTHAWTYVK